MRFVLVAVLTLAFGSAATAGQNFECGEARVEIAVSSRGELPLPAEDGRSTVTVSLGRDARMLSYIGGIDFIGGHCVKAADGRPLVVFQAYCGGSGCKDRDNWGIVDPHSLQVLVAPNDSNRIETQKVLGEAPTPPKEMLSVEREVSMMHKDAP